jgi:hypothetical protein
VAPLPSTDLRKLAAILARLASNRDGEVLAAAAAAVRFIEQHGASWGELLSPPPPPVPVVLQAPDAPRYWKHTAEECLFEHSQALSEWETKFLQDVMLRGRAPSVRQDAVLRRIAKKCGVPEW